MASPFLTADERKLLQEMLDRYRSERQGRGFKGTQNRQPIDAESHASPEVYVATVSDADTPIPARIPPGAPGAGWCDIYMIQEQHVEPLIISMGFRRMVYNLTDHDIWRQDKNGYAVYFLIHKTKYGKWVAGKVWPPHCTTIHLPSVAPPGINSHLYVSAIDTPDIQTEWGAQGVTGTFKTYAPECGQSDCITVVVQRGIITAITGFSVPATPTTIVNPEVFSKCTKEDQSGDPRA